MSAKESNSPSVDLTLEYAPDLAGGSAHQFASEHYPIRVDYYGTLQLSHAACGDHPSYRTLIIQSPESQHKLSVRLTAHANGKGIYAPFFEAGAYDNPLPTTQVEQAKSDGKLSVARSTSVVFNFYATTFTTLGQRCWTNVGVAQIFLEDLMTNQLPLRGNVLHNRSIDPDYTAQIKPLNKGTFQVTMASINNIVLRAASEFDTNGAKQVNAITTAMHRALNRGMGVFFKDKRDKNHDTDIPLLEHPIEEYLGPFHVPLFQTARFPLPSCTYCTLIPKRPIDVAYNERLLDIGLARSGATRPEALAWSSFLDSKASISTIESCGFMSVCARTVSAFALSQRYMDDVLNQNHERRVWDEKKVKPVEDFKICRLCGGDDCEGVCLETIIHVRNLAEAPNETLSQMSPLLRNVCIYLRLFVPIMTLGCVTNRKATAAPLDETNALAHTFCTLMPFWQFYTENTHRDLLLQSRFYKKNRALLEQFADNRTKNLAPIICEATAPIDPAMRPVESYYIDAGDRRVDIAIEIAKDRRELCNAIVKILDSYDLSEVLQPEMLSPPDRMSKTTAGKREYSGFYKFLMCGQTPVFADLRRLDFAFTVTTSRNNVEYGSQFSDIIAPHEAPNDESNGLSNTLVLTENEARIADAILLELQPLPALELASDNGMSTERLKKLTEILKKIQSKTTLRRKEKNSTPLHRRLQYLTISAEDINEKVVNAITQLSQLPEVRMFEYGWWVLNKAIDGTDRHNVILDIYLWF